MAKSFIKIKLVDGSGELSKEAFLVYCPKSPKPCLDYLDMEILSEQKSPNKFQNARNIFLRNARLTNKSVRKLFKKDATYRAYFYKVPNCAGLCDIYLFEEKSFDICAII